MDTALNQAMSHFKKRAWHLQMLHSHDTLVRLVWVLWSGPIFHLVAEPSGY